MPMPLSLTQNSQLVGISAGVAVGGSLKRSSRTQNSQSGCCCWAPTSIRMGLRMAELESVADQVLEQQGQFLPVAVHFGQFPQMDLALALLDTDFEVVTGVQGGFGTMDSGDRLVAASNREYWDSASSSSCIRLPALMTRLSRPAAFSSSLPVRSPDSICR